MLHGTRDVINTLQYWCTVHITSLTHCNMMHGTRDVINTLQYWCTVHTMSLTHCNMMHGTHNVINTLQYWCTVHTMSLTHCNMMHGTHNVINTLQYDARYTQRQTNCPNLNISTVLYRGHKSAPLNFAVNNLTPYYPLMLLSVTCPCFPKYPILFSSYDKIF
jgi:hypothetical protein